MVNEMREFVRSAPGESAGASSSSEALAKDASLVTYPSSSNNHEGKLWDRKQKRGYQRVRSLLEYWLSQGYQVLWVMLSTASDGEKTKLAEHHMELRQIIERQFGFEGIQHFQVRTDEGNGVLHVFWAWRADDTVEGFRVKRKKVFKVPQDWLSITWEYLHGAPIVYIERVRRDHKSVRDISKYVISQYVAGQSGYRYMSYSWRRSFGFGLCGCWREFKRRWVWVNGYEGFGRLIELWGRFMRFQRVSWFGDLLSVADAYKRWGSCIFDEDMVGRWEGVLEPLPCRLLM